MKSAIFYYIERLFCKETVVLFIFTGLFLLLRDVPLLKREELVRESLIAKVLGYTYIFASFIFFLIIRLVR